MAVKNPTGEEKSTVEARELREQASALGIDSSAGAPKTKLVRAIQRRLDQPACFAGDERFDCGERVCPWRDDCFQPIAEWRR